LVRVALGALEEILLAPAQMEMIPPLMYYCLLLEAVAVEHKIVTVVTAVQAAVADTTHTRAAPAALEFLGKVILVVTVKLILLHQPATVVVAVEVKVRQGLAL